MWKSALVGAVLGGVKYLALQERARQAELSLQGDEELLDFGGTLCLLRPEIATVVKASGLATVLADGIQAAAALDLGGCIERGSAWRPSQRRRRR